MADESPRINSLDVVRGAVMVLMAIDHVRVYSGLPAGGPTAGIFFTRWVTHFSAPAFAFLAGTAAFLHARKLADLAAMTRFLVTRGLFLVVLELTVLRTFAYQFNADYHVTFLLVIWALGVAMIFLGLIIALPTWLIATIGGALIVGHNAFDGVRPTNALLAILHGPGFVVQREGFTIFASYPLIPWIGVTALGFALAGVLSWEPALRRSWLLKAGLAAIAAFIAIRALNIYGDPAPWKAQATTGRTIASFILPSSMRLSAFHA